jgi:D-psicose/D-tagatose/L-ribulose 3-epimerase
MRIALANKVLEPLSFKEQCAYLARLGYDGIEIATATLGTDALIMPASSRTELKTIAEDAGLAIVGLNQVLMIEPGLSITSGDPAVRDRTLSVMRRTIDLCADLGGALVVHGSPNQRQPMDGDDQHVAYMRAAEAYLTVASHSASAKINYCIEPLAAHLTPIINSIDEAMQIIGHLADARAPGLCTMLDTLAARNSEAESVPALIARHSPTGFLRHIHINDRNNRAPGQGDDSFVDVIQKLIFCGYNGYVTLEPFEYHPDGYAQAAWGLGYMRAALESGSFSRKVAQST